jgi:3-oxoacyl-[acyl-carrier protein] reductase
MSSVVGCKGYVNQGAYAASKHALMGMTKVLAQEVFEDGIRVHVIAPGAVSTDMIVHTRPDLDASMLTSPEEIADIALFILTHRGTAVIDEVNVHRYTNNPWK